MKYFTYVLQNSISGNYYIGATKDLERRITEHNRGKSRSTKRVGVWNLVYSKEYDSWRECLRQEKLIKSYKGGNAFKKLIVRA